jgi:catechol 2,3-dioxygenase-like lactoylglutathione lyase family enzyme
MSFRMKRLILFVRNVRKVADYYTKVFGLEPAGNKSDADWAELDAGGCVLALHSGGAPGRKAAGGPKLVFWAEDVESSRAELLRRGGKPGKVRSFDGIAICDGKDPEGNAWQLSRRP